MFYFILFYFILFHFILFYLFLKVIWVFYIIFTPVNWAVDPLATESCHELVFPFITDTPHRISFEGTERGERQKKAKVRWLRTYSNIDFNLWRWGNDEPLSIVFADGQCILCVLKFSDKAWGLLNAVKYLNPDEVKKLLGKHIIEQHKDCDSVKWKYANYVHQSGKPLHRLTIGQSEALSTVAEVIRFPIWLRYHGHWNLSSVNT